MVSRSPRRTFETDVAVLVDLMQRLGLERVVGEAYAVLLTKGPLTTPEVIAESGGKPAAVNDALRRLARAHLAGTDLQRGRRVFYATDPAFAWVSLTADLVWPVITTRAPIRELPPTGQPDVENLRKRYRLIAQAAQRLYKPQRAATLHKERDAETEEELAILTCEIIYQARSQIRAVSRSPLLPQLSAFWTALTDRFAAGVSYTRIADLQEIIVHGLRIKHTDMENYNVNLRMIESSMVRQSFYIVDSRFLSTTHLDSADAYSRPKGVGRITTQRAVIDRYKKRFNQSLSASIPGRFVVAQLRRAGDELLQRGSGILAADEVAWLESLIEWGEFSEYPANHGWSSERAAAVERRAVAAGLARHTEDGKLVPVYPIDEAAIRAAYTAEADAGANED